MGSHYSQFLAVFKHTSTQALVNTVRNSQKRIDSGLTAAAEQVEIDRIQAAIDELDRRGYYAGKGTVKTASKHSAGRNIGALIALALVAYVLAK